MPSITAPQRPDGHSAVPAPSPSRPPELASECEAILKECEKTRADFEAVAERFEATLHDLRTRRALQRQRLYESLARNASAGTTQG